MAKRRSPDSIVCIDLTDDDHVRQEKLQDVRKRLKSCPTIHHPVGLASSQAASEADEDIFVVGTANECRLPHMRQHCPDHKVVQDVWVAINQEETLAHGNLAFCHLCYCYVCDKPAKDCTM
jgi:hypothetical protein